MDQSEVDSFMLPHRLGFVCLHIHASYHHVYCVSCKLSTLINVINNHFYQMHPLLSISVVLEYLQFLKRC